MNCRTYGQYFYKDWIFTPFKENSEDYEELDGLVEEYEVKKIVQGKEMDFLIRTIQQCTVQIMKFIFRKSIIKEI